MKTSIAFVTSALASVAAASTLNPGGLTGVHTTRSAYSIGAGSFEAGVSAKLEYGSEALDLYSPEREFLDVWLLSEDVFAAVGVTNGMDVALDLPFYQDFIDGLDKNAYGFGDLALSLKIMHPGMRSDALIRLAYVLRTSFPTGNFHHGYFARTPEYGHVSRVNKGGAYSSGGYNLNPLLAWTFDLTRLKQPKNLLVHVNLGADALFYPRDKKTIPQETSVMQGGLGLEWLASPSTSLFLDFYGKSRLLNITSGPFLEIFTRDQVQLALGTRKTFSGGLRATFVVEGGLSTQQNHTQWEVDHGTDTPTRYGTQPTPILGATLTLAFGRTGLRADSDHDGNPNVSDKCPQDAEDYDGYEDGNGCPDLVHMASEPVVHWDTVVVTQRDTVTVVRNDTVRVALADTLQYQSQQDPNRIFAFGKTIFPAINFKSGSDELLPTSFKTLNDIAQSMKNFPAVGLQVVGFTDNTGSPEGNKALSERRAKSVVDYLVKQGVEQGRLQHFGKGMEDPISPNTTADGRLSNRRVEFRRWK